TGLCGGDGHDGRHRPRRDARDRWDRYRGHRRTGGCLDGGWSGLRDRLVHDAEVGADDDAEGDRADDDRDLRQNAFGGLVHWLVYSSWCYWDRWLMGNP